jgi:hypothetical protein
MKCLGGVFLVVAFIFFGQLIEEFFKAVNKFLIGWKTLLFAIFLLYALIIGMLCQLRGDAIDLSVRLFYIKALFGFI